MIRQNELMNVWCSEQGLLLGINKDIQSKFQVFD